MGEPRLECSRAREVLWPPEQPRLACDEVVAAWEHLDVCASCQDYFRQDRRLLELYQRLPREQAPKHLRDRVFDAIARERAGLGGEETRSPADAAARRDRVAAGSFSRARGLRLAGLAASGVLAVALGTSIERVGSEAAPAGESGAPFVEDYLRRAVAQDRIVSDDLREVSRFLARELGLILHPLDGAGVQIRSAEICLVDGKRGAMIEYEWEGRIVSHYLVPGTHEGRTRQPELAAPGSIDHGSPHEPAVVTWSSAQLQEALVADAPSARLLSLARMAVDRR